MAVAVCAFASAFTAAQAATCDLAKCTCDGVSLASLRNTTVQAPTDSEGYTYQLSLCGEIPRSELPSGCAQCATCNDQRAAPIFCLSSFNDGRVLRGSQTRSILPSSSTRQTTPLTASRSAPSARARRASAV